MIARITIIAAIIVNVATLYGQKPPSFSTNDVITNLNPIVCPANHTFSDHYVPPRSKAKSPYKQQAITLTAQYDIDVPQDVRTAIETRVFPLIEEAFSSTIPIKISFSWDQTGVGTLASASPRLIFRNFDPKVPIFNVFYPGPLAEKIAGRELSDPELSDIQVTINQNIDWCLDCDTPAEVGPDRFDFVSTILHEIYHGLGIFAFAGIDDAGNAFQGNPPGSGLTSVFNYYMELISGEKTIALDDGSVTLLNHFQSNQLFFNLQSAGRAKLFAPNPFRQGSSISHLDEATFSGGINALMTPSSSRGEVERSAGIADDMLYDMGWIFTELIHEPVDPSIEQPVGDDFVVSVDVKSENGIMEETLLLHYSYDEFTNEDIEVPFTKIDEDTYQATIPSPNEIRVANYYIEVEDVRSVRFSSPGVNFNDLQFAHQYAFGPDEIAPVLTHEPVTTIKSVDTEVSLFANANDVFAGIDTVLVDWNYNGTAQPTVGMTLDTTDLFEDDRYIVSLPLPSGLSVTDVIEYKFTAIDAASGQNQSSLPETGFFTIAVEEVSSAIEVYNNDFNDNTTDFEGIGFAISQPAGFADLGIHSDHPYESAGENRTLNLTYELKQPIVLLGPDRANMEFDEIVLVEPGELTARFGDQEFWDYVIVEGQKLGTNAWLPFLNGYDSGSNIDWRTAYNNGIPNGSQDSGRNGDPGLFRPRAIDLLQSGNFNTGDEVIIRFRLFSDPFARGWGWAVDNLFVQDESVPVSDFVLRENIEISPNPSSDFITLELQLETVSKRIAITINDMTGKSLINDIVTTSDQSIIRNYNIKDFIPGAYIVNVVFDNKETISKKLIINK